MFVISESQITRWGRALTVSIILFLFVSVALPLKSTPLGGSEAFAIKPSPPLNLSLSHSPKPDGQYELTLQAEANVAAEKVELAFDLPDSVDRVSGELKWSGTIPVGEKKTIKASIRILANILATVIGTATVYMSQGGILTQQETLLLNPPQTKSTPRTGPTKTQKPGHEKILEFKRK